MTLTAVVRIDGRDVIVAGEVATSVRLWDGSAAALTPGQRREAETLLAETYIRQLARHVVGEVGRGPTTHR